MLQYQQQFWGKMAKIIGLGLHPGYATGKAHWTNSVTAVFYSVVCMMQCNGDNIRDWKEFGLCEPL